MTPRAPAIFPLRGKQVTLKPGQKKHCVKKQKLDGAYRFICRALSAEIFANQVKFLDNASLPVDQGEGFTQDKIEKNKVRNGLGQLRELSSLTIHVRHMNTLLGFSNLR